MRKLTRFKSREDLEQFQSYLFYHKIESHAYEDPEDFNLWILRDEDKLLAQQLLSLFERDFLRKEGGDEAYQEVLEKSRQGTALFSQKQRAIKEKEKKFRVIDARRSSFGAQGFHLLSVTGFLLAFSVLIFFLANSAPTQWSVYKWLTMSRYVNVGFLPFEILEGEVWRLVSPIFIHGGFFHILFNMMWLYQLGPLVENREGGIAYSLFILFVAISSNWVFYLIVGPQFGGMSGVLYGLVGYFWGYRKVAPLSPQFLDEGTMRFFLVWYILCWGISAFSGSFGFGVANTVHGIGALSGALFGAVRAFQKEEGSIPVKRLFEKESLMTAAIIFFLIFGSILIDRASI